MGITVGGYDWSTENGPYTELPYINPHGYITGADGGLFQNADPDIHVDDVNGPRVTLYFSCCAAVSGIGCGVYYGMLKEFWTPSVRISASGLLT